MIVSEQSAQSAAAMVEIEAAMKGCSDNDIIRNDDGRMRNHDATSRILSSPFRRLALGIIENTMAPVTSQTSDLPTL